MGGSHSTTALHPLLLPLCLTDPLTGGSSSLHCPFSPPRGCRRERGTPGLTLDPPASSCFSLAQEPFLRLQLIPLGEELQTGSARRAGVFLFCACLFLEQCLTHSRYLENACWMSLRPFLLQRHLDRGHLYHAAVVLCLGHNVGLNGEERILAFLTLSLGGVAPEAPVRESKERFLKENL